MGVLPYMGVLPRPTLVYCTSSVHVIVCFSSTRAQRINEKYSSCVLPAVLNLSITAWQSSLMSLCTRSSNALRRSWCVVFHKANALPLSSTHALRRSWCVVFHKANALPLSSTNALRRSWCVVLHKANALPLNSTHALRRSWCVVLHKTNALPLSSTNASWCVVLHKANPLSLSHDRNENKM